MTNYNDGNWHGWNGGECPVHPETIVEARYLMPVNSQSYICRAIRAKERGKECWGHTGGANPIIAFRVVKEHREPVEVWGDGSMCFWDTRDEALRYCDGEPRLFREVIE